MGVRYTNEYGIYSNSTTGHREWVTCVAFTADGKVLSGGMDSMLCLWTGTRAQRLEGHNASVSALKVDERNIAISGSYDGVYICFLQLR